MAITAVSHVEVVRNNRSEVERLGTLAQNMEETTSTTSLVVNEVTERSKATPRAAPPTNPRRPSRMIIV